MFRKNAQNTISNHFNNYFMKKFFSNLKAIIGCTVVTAMLASSVVSCQYDDTELRGEIDNVKKELSQLRTDLQSQIDALKGLVNGLVTVKSVVTDDAGVTTVTLSDNTVFTVQPEASLEGVITIVEYEGVKYWAQYNAEGEAVLISVNGANCPVVSAEPMTRVNEETNSIEVSFDGGLNWVATGSYTGVVKAEIIYSEWQFDDEGNALPLYAQFTMADGTVVKTHVEGQAIMLWTDSAYAAYGSTTTLPLYANIGEFAEYMFQLPAGWSAEVVEDEYAKENFGVIGEVEIYFTAPSAAAVASGAAAAEGEAKMLVQFQNGDMSIAKMRVTTKVADIEVSADGMKFTNNGWDPYAYGSIFFGITKKADFDKAYIVEDIAAWGYEVSLGYLGFDESGICEYSWDVYPEELVPGEQYVVWIAPGMIDMNTYCPVTTEADITYVVYTHTEVSFEVVAQHLFDVEANFSIAGTDVFGGFMTQVVAKEQYDPKYLAQMMTENSYYWQYGYTKADGEYTGKLTGWAAYGPDALNPDTDYLLCVFPGNESLVFTPADILTWEFSTKAVETTGGTITLAVDENSTSNDYSQMTVYLVPSAEATVAYHKFVPKHEASAYTTDELIIEYLLDSENKATISKNPGTGIWCSAGSWNVEGEPGDEFTLFAVAAEADGKLGKPLAFDYNYKAMEFNDLVVDVVVSDLNFEEVKIDVTCEGASKFLYKVMAIDSYQWTEKSYCNGSAEGASKYFTLNSNSPYTVHHSDANTQASYYGCRFENNQIIYTGGSAGVTYVVCVAAQDESVKLSKVTAVEFTPMMNMGTVRYKEDAEWESSKPVVAMLQAETIGDFYTFDWYVTPVEGYTAYTVAEHNGNYDEAGIDTTDIKQMIQFIVSHDDVVKCEYSADGYFVDRGSYDEYWDWIENWVEVPGVVGSVHYGTEGYMDIWTTWCDAEGNYFEPFRIDGKM